MHEVRKVIKANEFNDDDIIDRLKTTVFTVLLNNNNNNNLDDVYGAIIMTIVIARVHPVHLMNLD